MEKYAAIIEVLSTTSQSCPFYCKEHKGPDFQDRVNHLISAHNCKLLHVGGHVVDDYDGKPAAAVVAILGSEEPLPPRPPVPERFKSMTPPTSP